MPKEAEDLTGRQFGSRKVLGRARARRYDYGTVLYWRVQCTQCGTINDVQGGSLRQGAGCAVCRKRAADAAAVMPPSPPKALQSLITSPTRHVPERSPQRQLTWGELKDIMVDVPDKVPVLVNMVGDKGWAAKPAVGVQFIGMAVVVATELPAEIQRWKVSR